MKNILLYFYAFILLYLYSCNLEEFHFSKLSPQSNYDEHPDSIKLNQSFDFEIGLSDDNKTVYLLPEYNNTLCQLELNGDLLTSGQKIQYTESYLTIRPIQTGKVRYSLTFEDIYGNSDTLSFAFVSFSNLSPIANLELVEVGQLSDYEIIIDASKSYDQDQNYDGKIVSYKYQIDDWFSLTTDKSKINYILPQKGSYTVSCQVQDNDNSWSEPVFQDVNL